MVRGPMMGDVTAGWCSSQARATAAGVALQCVAELFIGFQFCAVRLDVFSNVLVCPSPGRVRAQRPSKQASRQGAPGNDPDSIGLTGRKDFQLDGSFEEIVKTLFGDEPQNVA
jgi:hypothetical protein